MWPGKSRCLSGVCSMIRQLDEQEILRYLGYPAGNAPDPEVAALIRQCSTRLLETARPKYIENIFPLNHTEGAVMLSGSDIRLTGNAITNHLQNCTQCVIMAATLGIEADRAIRQAQLSIMTEALVMDACATAFIEAVCDEAEAEINQKYGPCNFRFSPGYGDLPITLQKDLLAILQAEKKIGLHVNTSNLLIPGKSVTAILGVTDRGQRPKSKCDLCQNKERCAFCRNGK